MKKEANLRGSKKHEDENLQKGIETLVEQSGAFQFLNDEEDLYSEEDIKEKTDA